MSTSHRKAQTTRPHHRGRCDHAPPITILNLTRALALALPTTTAIKLSDFQPYINHPTLTPSCLTVYTTEIPGCTRPDFAADTTCSSACINGLVAIQAQVYTSCADAQDDQRLIGQFLLGSGIPLLCPEVVIVTQPPHTPTLLPTAVPTPEPTQSPTPSVYGSSGYDPATWLGGSLQSSHTTNSPTTTSTRTMHSTIVLHPTTSSTSTRQNPSQPSQQSSGPSHTSNTAQTGSRTTSQQPTGTHTTAAQYDHCVEYEGNPFKSCGDDAGSGAVGLVVTRRGWGVLWGMLFAGGLLVLGG